MVELSIPFFWRLEKQRYRLVGERCESCSKVFFPGSGQNECSECKGKIFDFQLSGKGRVVSWSTIHVPPEGFEAPYTVGIIEFDEGPRGCGQIVGSVEKLRFGCGVRATFRKIGEHSNGFLIYGLKFEVVD